MSRLVFTAEWRVGTYRAELYQYLQTGEIIVVEFQDGKPASADVYPSLAAALVALPTPEIP